MVDFEKEKQTRPSWSKSEFFLKDFTEMCFELRGIWCLASVGYDVVCVISMPSQTFLLFLLYREDSDDDDIEKGDQKMPR